MNRYVEWKRKKIQERWIRRVVIGVGGYFAVALIIIAVSYVNRFVIYATLS
jgi:hypothetical protein